MRINPSVATYDAIDPSAFSFGSSDSMSDIVLTQFSSFSHVLPASCVMEEAPCIGKLL
jgi:hypothetical protein